MINNRENKASVEIHYNVDPQRQYCNIQKKTRGKYLISTKLSFLLIYMLISENNFEEIRIINYDQA